ncbi:hypothetical protein EDB89DRAFT_1913298 [Lactarius sanguifluus]|nr:hypothetical protein EDB89DRAFT_1913298 [Lactarius sanguifluus]
MTASARLMVVTHSFVAAKSGPQIVIDTDNIILAWYLPGVLSEHRQNTIMVATEKLHPLLRKNQTGTSSCTQREISIQAQMCLSVWSPYHWHGSNKGTRSGNFQQPMSWLEEISESNTILSVILGQETFSNLQQAAEIVQQDVLKD